LGVAPAAALEAAVTGQGLPGLLVILVLFACGGGTGERSMVDTTAASLNPTLHIVITTDPAVYADGRATSLIGLDSQFSTLKGANGEVWLYREARDPHTAAEQDSLVDSVLMAITRHAVPFRLSRRPDFSDQTGKRRHPQRSTP
jgi:hypothetical protein